MSALAPAVRWLNSFRVPKALAIVLIYVVIFTTLGGILTISFTPLIEDTTKLFFALPSVLTELFKFSNIDVNLLQQQLPDLSKNILSISKSVFDNLITVILLLVLTFYLLLERESLEERLGSLFGNREERIKKLTVKIEEKLGHWLRGQMMLSVIVGTLVYFGLSLLQIPYALPLALWAAVLEVVPVIGPIISAIPAILIAFTVSPVIGGGVATMYFVIQQLENNLIVPQVMKKAVGLNPLVVILAIAIGGRLLGIGGALLSVPLVVVLQTIFMDFLITPKE